MTGYAYAEISVNSPIAQRKTFSYRIPSGLGIDIGQAVWVPFGNKTLQGVVLELTAYPAVAETRDIAGIIETIPVLSPYQITLARWLGSYYLAPLFASVALMLPPGFERSVITFIEQLPEASTLPVSLMPEQAALLRFIGQTGRVSLRELEKRFGIQRVQKSISRLTQQRLVVRRYEMERPKVRPKIVPHLYLKIKPEEAWDISSNLGERARRQSRLLRFLADNPAPVALPKLKSRLDCPSGTIKALVNKGLIEIQEARIERDPISARNIKLSFPLSLTAAQKAVFKLVQSSLQKRPPYPGRPGVYLLRGVTGSGKTEIYLRALEEAVKAGKKGIVLVPEISMTPQIIERFISRFPGRVAIMHSELSLGEQLDEWWRIKRGEFDVVIGPRSAIFAPQPDLGLIIIDEEHEWTYKQQDTPPCYHTRQVALKLAELTGATVVMGSATPDVESYFKAVNGEFHLLELPERVTPDVGAPLPDVEIVDLKKELRAGNLSLFSNSLYHSIESALDNHRQILLFLNRRGAASIVECRNCGSVIRCKRCEIPLSYHSADEMLICHQCNYHIKVPQTCPRCRSRSIKYLGVGTEKLEQETAQAFPRARILRWDSDAIGPHHSHQEVFNKFKAGKADILIGTQMIAKGLDLPGVILVGVVCADIALNLPDFRAGERTFQLLTQVAGRAGRGEAGGKAIIQTYSPENYVIRSAAGHDYMTFYQKELAYRRELRNPPFNCLARLTFTHVNEGHCQEESERIKRVLMDKQYAEGIADVNLIGPAPAYFHRLRGRFRWQIILRSHNPSDFLSGIQFPQGWSVDIDPVGLT